MILKAANKRTRVLITVAGTLLVWVVISAIVIPIHDLSVNLDRKLEGARKDRKEVAELADRYITLTASLPPSMRQESSDSGLLTAVENVSRRMGMEKNIERMVPASDPKNKGEEQLSLTITNLPYNRFVEFLRGIYESGSAIGVKRARITVSFENRNNIGAELLLERSR